jgi:putative tricarboxylic transport membrane protein
VLPMILSWCMIGSGGLLAIKSILGSDEPIATIAWRPFLLVTLGVVSFGLLIDDWGLIITMIISMTLCAIGTVETRWPEFAIFTLVMIAIGFGMFIWLLGMPINTWPTKAIPSFLSIIVR